MRLHHTHLICFREGHAVQIRPVLYIAAFGQHSARLSWSIKAFWELEKTPNNWKSESCSVSICRIMQSLRERKKSKHSWICSCFVIGTVLSDGPHPVSTMLSSHYPLNLINDGFCVMFVKNKQRHKKWWSRDNLHPCASSNGVTLRGKHSPPMDLFPEHVLFFKANSSSCMFASYGGPL